MSFVLPPWQLQVAILVGWVNQRQREPIDYLRTENQVLRERLGQKRILLNDAQRRLAVIGKALGGKGLQEFATLLTPDMILRWHRKLVAEKWNYTDRRRKCSGRPPVSEEIRQLVLQMAGENPTWGYDRLQGALQNLGHEISDQTVGNILQQNGIKPAPKRTQYTSPTSWKTFLKSHWEVLGAIDFTTIDHYAGRGGRLDRWTDSVPEATGMVVEILSPRCRINAEYVLRILAVLSAGRRSSDPRQPLTIVRNSVRPTSEIPQFRSKFGVSNKTNHYNTFVIVPVI